MDQNTGLPKFGAGVHLNIRPVRTLEDAQATGFMKGSADAVYRLSYADRAVVPGVFIAYGIPPAQAARLLPTRTPTRYDTHLGGVAYNARRYTPVPGPIYRFGPRPGVRQGNPGWVQPS